MSTFEPEDTPEMFDREYISDRAYAELARLTAQLAAMTERRDTLLRIVRAYRSELIDYVTEKVNDDEVNAMYSTPDEEIKSNFIRWFSRRRREARNGHTD